MMAIEYFLVWFYHKLYIFDIVIYYLRSFLNFNQRFQTIIYILLLLYHIKNRQQPTDVVMFFEEV